ncbi:MAG: 50S ribosomal protein L10 [Chloroflexi bacterium]|nr:50S ribosomal protein L10 [Chloroflexota bacterium]
MAITKERKEELVIQYKDFIEQSDAVFLTEYKGMTVKDIQALRLKLREVDGRFYITKNTLLKLALEESDMPAPSELLVGQVASGFAMGEAPALAKALVNFAKKEDNLTIRGGVMDQEVLSLAQVEALAELPSLDQLRAQIIGLIDGPARGLVSTVNSGVRQVVNVVDAFARSEEADPEAA